MAARQITFSATSAQYGGGVFTVTDSDTGYELGGVYSDHTITLSGLNGGTFTVEVLCGDGVWRPFDLGKPSGSGADILRIRPDNVRIDGFRITTASLGLGADPSLLLRSQIHLS